MPKTTQFLTVPALAERYGVTQNKILTWIARGALSALDVSTARAERPQWRIHVDEVERFESDRRSVPTMKPPRRTNRKQMAGVIEYVK